MSLVYNSETKLLIDRVMSDMPHALLLVGEHGVGLGSIARAIAWRDIAGVIVPTDKDGNADPSTKGEIRILQIRQLIQSTRGKSAHHMIYIIDEADKMTTAAQNAFLKLLEEPANHVSFILTAHAPHLLLPTVRSRVQTLPIHQLSREQSEQFIRQAGVTDARKTQQLLFLASGRPAELQRLISDDRTFSERAKIIADAREYLQGKAYQKAIIVQKYAGERALALELVQQAINLLEFSLKASPSTQSINTANQLSTIYDRIAANGNIRLQLTTFVV